jgi:PHD/YefM family antitoxin component YafN of YafNO toxin-antitoxin module
MLSTSEVNYAWAHQHLAELMDKVLEENSVTIISRGGSDPIAMLPAAELSSMLEAIHIHDFEDAELDHFASYTN